MDIERLTKSQIVLLTLLVSFVTSIATGIVTVTLIDQAPPAITQTVNRVVERTVERVVPDKTQNAAAATVTTEKTIVVKEEDLITDSIDKNTKHLVRIATPAGADGTGGVFLGLGVIVAREGIVATDASLVGAAGVYTVTLQDGTNYRATVARKAAGSPVALLALEQATEAEEPRTFSPVAAAAPDSLKLGQTVLSLGGRERVNVGMGIIAGIGMTDVAPAEEGQETTQKLTSVETTIANRAMLPGSLLLNIFGEVVGINTKAAYDRAAGTYTPARVIQQELSALSQETAEGGAASESQS